MASTAVTVPDVTITVHWHVLTGGFLDWHHV